MFNLSNPYNIKKIDDLTLLLNENEVKKIVSSKSLYNIFGILIIYLFSSSLYSFFDSYVKLVNKEGAILHLNSYFLILFNSLKIH